VSNLLLTSAKLTRLFPAISIVSMYLVLPWLMFGLTKLYWTQHVAAPVAVVLVVGASLCALILHYLFYWCRYRGGYQTYVNHVST
jgi:hypothetical protein